MDKQFMALKIASSNLASATRITIHRTDLASHKILLYASNDALPPVAVVSIHIWRSSKQ